MNCKTLIALVFIVFLTNSLSSQTYSDLISDEEIISFIKWEIKNTKPYHEEPFFPFKRRISRWIYNWELLNFQKPDSIPDDHHTLWLTYLFTMENQLDTIFSRDDREFLIKQFSSQKDTAWRHKFSGAKITSRSVGKHPNRYYYSIPLFSIDKELVIIKRYYYCGIVCAHGGYFIYRRIDSNDWKLIRVVNAWIS